MAAPADTSPSETRRDRLRRELTADVIRIARTQLEAGGRAGVSWRGLAREVGMNPASLYTYFDSLDDVFTAVILDSFRRLAAALQSSASEHGDLPPLDRLVASALVYRQWARQHPAEFNLIFTDQIPGYAAPPDGPTVQVQEDIFSPFLESLTELVDGEATALSTTANPSRLIGLWGTMHGLVMLEINHHLPFIDDHEEVFVDSLRRAVSALT